MELRQLRYFVRVVELGSISGQLKALQESVSEKRQDIAGALVRISLLEQRKYADPDDVQSLMWRAAMVAGALSLCVAMIPVGLYLHNRSASASVVQPQVRP